MLTPTADPHFVQRTLLIITSSSASNPCPLTTICPSEEEDSGWASSTLAKPSGSVSPLAPPPTTPTSDMDFCLSADFHRINHTIQTLRTSGYYYEGLSWKQAALLLHPTAEGTFLVRDSADPRFLFALSVQTERGPTSVRIHYVQGQFRLDSEESLSSFMPLFDCVAELVEYYVNLSQSVKGSSCVWLDNTGRRDLPIRLCRPLYKTVPSLQHLCRIGVNARLHKLQQHRSNGQTSQGLVEVLGPLPNALKAYLREYPHLH